MFRLKYKKLRVYGVYRTAQLEAKVVEFAFENASKKQAIEIMYDYLFNAQVKGGLGISHRSIIKIFTMKSK